jgi:hypothetical protein
VSPGGGRSAKEKGSRKHPESAFKKKQLERVFGDHFTTTSNQVATMNVSLSNCRGFLQPSEDDVKGMERKQARDMMQLAKNERERALNDLHGIVDVQKEHEPPAWKSLKKSSRR